MRATTGPQSPRPLLARVAGVTVAVVTTLVTLVALPAAYLLLDLPLDGRVAAISVVSGVIAGLLVQRRLDSGAARQRSS